MKTVVIIQARRGGSRFPGKVNTDLGGRTILERVVEAAQKIEMVDDVVVAWPESVPEVSEGDVLGRYAAVAARTHAEAVVRITADCPFLDPETSSLVVRRYMNGDLDYVSNVWPRRTWPDGLDTEIFSRYWLDRANAEALTAYDREHVTPWIRRNATRVANVELPVDWSWVRLTVDTPEDLEWLRQCLKAPKS